MNAHRLPSPDPEAKLRQDVANWIRANAKPLATTDPAAPVDDLEPLRGIVGDAVIVGLGGSTYGAREQFTTIHRVVRFLVEELGFRAVATEEDWDVALPLNDYVRSGYGDLDALMKESGVPWRVHEMRDAVEYLRQWNATHPDDLVQFVGVGVIDTRLPVYDAVTEYVAKVAPARADELAAHIDVIRPTRPDHVPWFIMQVKDKDPYVEHARQALRLVQESGGSGKGHDLAVQHARQIVAFYEHYAYHLVDDGYRDEQMAENLRWWHQYSGDRIAYWSTNAHSVRAESLDISVPPRGSLTFKPTGATLASVFGDGYVSIGLTYDRGTVNSGWSAPPFAARPLETPTQPEDFHERPFANDVPRYLVDLRAEADEAVREWLGRTVKGRVIGSVCDDSRPDDHYMTGGSLLDWYDAVIHEQTVTPSTPL
ncbi:erythromycin esterase family protein [Actinophytocola sp. NPDC049390]|uniref:erythromycin esterase family protein n=1 Tax=Actinophytocola sp. NPDC049390 TaxID=3363894 RepID=UPI00379D9651